MQTFLRIMKALSDPSRVRFLKALEMGEWCVCDFQEASGLAQPTVSKHMKVLEAAGLVAFRKQGQWVHYRLVDAGLSPYAATMLRNLSGWLNEDPETAALLERMLRHQGEKACEADPPAGTNRKKRKTA